MVREQLREQPPALPPIPHHTPLGFFARAPHLRCADIEASRAQICHESGGHIGHSNDSWVNRSYVGDVQQLVENDFKGVKIDNCGLHNDMEKYAELMNTTGKAFLTERSDQGHGTPINDPVGNQTAGWCPYNLFRSSGDIRANWGSVHGNLQTVKKYTNVSRPGCCERRLHSRARVHVRPRCLT